MTAPSVIVLGGPNGAGKSTLAPALLRDALGVTAFVNADEIARGLSGFAPEAAALRAGRIMLDRLAELTHAHATFAFESTLAGRGVGDVLTRCRSEGYHVHIVYLWLPSPEFALARVLRRVAEGGHGIPEPDVRRRWARSLINFLDTYRPLADTWFVFDGTRVGAPTPVARGRAGDAPDIYLRDVWAVITAQVEILRQPPVP